MTELSIKQKASPQRSLKFINKNETIEDTILEMISNSDFQSRGHFHLNKVGSNPQWDLVLKSYRLELFIRLHLAWTPYLSSILAQWCSMGAQCLGQGGGQANTTMGLGCWFPHPHPHAWALSTARVVAFAKVGVQTAEPHSGVCTTMGFGCQCPPRQY